MSNPEEPQEFGQEEPQTNPADSAPAPELSQGGADIAAIIGDAKAVTDPEEVAPQAGQDDLDPTDTNLLPPAVSPQVEPPLAPQAQATEGEKATDDTAPADLDAAADEVSPVAPEVTPAEPTVTPADDVPPAPTHADLAEESAPSATPTETESTLVKRRRLIGAVPTEEETAVSEPTWSPRIINDIEKAPTKEELQDSIFEGATVVPTVASRTAAHAWYFLIALVMTPITWYLVADSGSRLTMSGGQWDTLTVKPFTLLEFAAAVACVILLVLPARWSSVGAFFSGLVFLVVGLPFLVVPALTANFLDPAITALNNFNAFGANVAHHLVADGSTGRLVIYGLALILLGFVSHGARRKGRKEAAVAGQQEKSEDEVKPSRKERRAARKAAKAAGKSEK